jgi:hypothetical protein
MLRRFVPSAPGGFGFALGTSMSAGVDALPSSRVGSDGSGSGGVIIATPLCVTPARGLKTKKRPKTGAKFVKDSQAWREQYQSSQQRVLADSLRAYVGYANARRHAPYDPRFKPFDREEVDGVYVVMRYLMRDRLEAVRNHAAPTKRLFCNVGLLGPQVTTVARWRSVRGATLSEKTQLLKEAQERDRTVRNRWYSD